jgi:hypothetical protein
MSSQGKARPIILVAAGLAIAAAVAGCNSGGSTGYSPNTGTGGYSDGSDGGDMAGYYGGMNQDERIQGSADNNEGAGISADPGGDAGAGDGDGG